MSIELYHADWCSHCVNFMPVWKEIIKNSSVKTTSFKDGSFNNPKVSGYPTLIINGEVYEGPRTYDSIIKAATSSQQTGAGGVDYKYKYKKYKEKYLATKSEP